MEKKYIRLEDEIYISLTKKEIEVVWDCISASGKGNCKTKLNVIRKLRTGLKLYFGGDYGGGTY